MAKGVSSYKGRRDKGIRGEAEARKVLEAAGFAVRGLEGMGDHLAIKTHHEGERIDTIVFHVEVKRQETLRVDFWHQQAIAEAPDGTIPLLVYRRNGNPWRAVVLLDDLLHLLR